jgi:hypothetical protein
VFFSDLIKMILASLFFAIGLEATVLAGVGKSDITPPLGTPSAGYAERRGAGMEGVHDPLLATSLYLESEGKKIVLCSVDHLGFTYEMVQAVSQKVKKNQELEKCDIFISSTHTHSGGGAFLLIPIIGELLAGSYSETILESYIDKTVEAILASYQSRVEAKIGLGYGKVENISYYRGMWPKGISPLSEVSVIKVTRLDGKPLAALFNYPVHPTVLNASNRLFSADFVGYARSYIQGSIGSDVVSIYFNGAQGDINPIISNESDRYESCEKIGKTLAIAVKEIWDRVDVSDTLELKTKKDSYSFKPMSTPQGISIPQIEYHTEMNLITFNKEHAFITIPGELSCLYDQKIKERADHFGFTHVSILGLTNDAHGYIILPESWHNKTYESGFSFGGESYGEQVMLRCEKLLESK